MNMQSEWLDELPVGITVCDAKGTILSMNDRAALIFKQSGGRDLIGKNLLECHPPAAQKKVEDLFARKEPNAYTVEIKGVTFMLYQAPRHENGRFEGFVEFIFALPDVMAKLDKINWVKK
ncbi:MAG: PAS domain-containing protein [Smithellaceae bacterium]